MGLVRCAAARTASASTTRAAGEPGSAAAVGLAMASRWFSDFSGWTSGRRLWQRSGICVRLKQLYATPASSAGRATTRSACSVEEIAADLGRGSRGQVPEQALRPDHLSEGAALPASRTLLREWQTAVLAPHDAGDRRAFGCRPSGRRAAGPP